MGRGGRRLGDTCGNLLLLCCVKRLHAPRFSVVVKLHNIDDPVAVLTAIEHRIAAWNREDILDFEMQANRKLQAEPEMLAELGEPDEFPVDFLPTPNNRVGLEFDIGSVEPSS